MYVILQYSDIFALVFFNSYVEHIFTAYVQLHACCFSFSVSLSVKKDSNGKKNNVIEIL